MDDLRNNEGVRPEGRGQSTDKGARSSLLLMSPIDCSPYTFKKKIQPNFFLDNLSSVLLDIHHLLHILLLLGAVHLLGHCCLGSKQVLPSGGH